MAEKEEFLNYKEIEDKWQKAWEKENAFQVDEKSDKEKFYVWRAKYRDSQMTWTYNKETKNVTFTWTHKD